MNTAAPVSNALHNFTLSHDWPLGSRSRVFPILPGIAKAYIMNAPKSKPQNVVGPVSVAHTTCCLKNGNCNRSERLDLLTVS